MLDQAKIFASWFRNRFDSVFSRLYPNLVVPRVDLVGKTAVVTGANVGIGYAIALELASQGAHVVLACRDKAKGEEARRKIAEISGSSTVEVEVLDNASLESVRGFLTRWTERKGQKIDILVNNAGMNTSRKNTTADGHEITYQVNFMSSFLLTISLLRQNLISPTARIVQVSSQEMFCSSKLDPADVGSGDILAKIKEGEHLPTGVMLQLYSRSKASQVVFTKELQEKLSASQQWSQVIVQACHPGLVKSDIWVRSDGAGSYGWVSSVLKTVSDIIGISTQQGAVTPVFLATSEEAGLPGNRGKFWSRCLWQWVPGWMADTTLCKALWRKWLEDSGLEDGAF